MLDTPVLFIIFNRAETTRRVFEAIRQAKPKQLFVAADGPRLDKDGEKERCEEVRNIATAVDWDCEVKTLFRDKNLGCGRGPATAIDWFFEHVEKGIILEDDCLPMQSFFTFCNQLLEHYKNDERIMQIAGTNVLGSWNDELFDYHFSKYAGIWGWATWRRAWKHYDYYLKAWEDQELQKFLSYEIISVPDFEYRINRFEETFKYPEKINWWDYQWHFARLSQSGIGIIPSKNLIRNIGFGENATHTFDMESPYSNIKAFEIDVPVRLRTWVINDKKFDEKVVGGNKETGNNILSRILNRIKN